ncbi:MAG: AlpA family phage regulatory protein [Planctomycetes bacterium]|nr:AlpA family phage regulatory protein [Planctomycetota bacterium]
MPKNSRQSLKSSKSGDHGCSDELAQSADSDAAPTHRDLPLLLGAKTAAELVGVSESTFWKLHSQGRIPNPMRLGGRVVRWRRCELSAWVRAGCPSRANWSYHLNSIG